MAEAASWLEPPLELPEELYKGMTDHGVIRDRTAEFNWTIWDHLKWLCRFVQHVDQQIPAAISKALKDPLKFHDLAAGTPGDQPAIRRSIEYLAWPSYFEPVVADVERQEIRDAFASLVGGAKGDTDEDITADIHRIRLHLDEQAGQRIDWYARQLVSQWRKVGDPGRRAWLLRTHSDNAELLSCLAGRGEGDARRRTPPPPGRRRDRRAGAARRGRGLQAPRLRGTRGHQDGGVCDPHAS